jgi:hypothetical protein
MLPRKHYAAPEIEAVLDEAENGGLEPSLAAAPETHAEESTLRRWIKEFSVLLPIMAGWLEQMAETPGMTGASLVRLSDRPLRRIRRAVEALQELPSGVSRLAYAFEILTSHPVCL